jgi:hypothetical protein
MRTLSPRLSKSAPSDEADTPFPRLEQTPPETNINLFMNEAMMAKKSAACQGTPGTLSPLTTKGNVEFADFGAG